MVSSPYAVPVPGGAVPLTVVGDLAAAEAVALVLPSVFGALDDLLAQLADLSARASRPAAAVVVDPFWRVHPGPLGYDQMAPAVDRMKRADLAQTYADYLAAAAWARGDADARRIVGLGICFGGGFVLRAAADQAIDAGVTWHGSRMDLQLDRAAEVRVPLSLHFGDRDGVTPPAVLAAIRAAFAPLPHVDVQVHPGARHGFSHRHGKNHDAEACDAGEAALVRLLGA